MRIFVTGATGFIGAHFVDKAIAAGHRITALYRSESLENSAVLAHLRDLGVDLRRGDVLDPASLDEAARGCEVVCHFAAAFKEAQADGTYFHRVNVEGTVAVLAAAARAGAKRFVYCSTAGIYGRRVAGVVDESSPPQPWNAYERSKLAAEQKLREGAPALGMEYVILRPSAVYGPHDDRLAKLFRSAAKGRFPLFGRGEGRRHMVYVGDVADAFLRACVEPAAANTEMIVAGPEAVPLRQMLEVLAQVNHRRRCGPQLPLAPMLALAAVVEDTCRGLRIKPPIYRRRMDFYLNDAAFDCARARQVLGWEPRVCLRDGFASTLKAESSPW